jgi:2-polyprenyl-3-methyl-5-hydroxy-6-metoxy-1,4-benzoquinol methylase
VTDAKNICKTSEQLCQESAYSFPYHYLVRSSPDFSISREWAWGLHYAANLEFLKEKISRRCNFDSIVDIGCGDGRFTRELKYIFPETRIAGVDYSKRAINLACALNDGLGIEFSSIDITATDFDSDFEAATLIEVYEHIPPDRCKPFLKGISNILSPGGFLFVTVPHSNIPVSRHHFRHFNSTLLIEEFSEIFDVIETEFLEETSKRIEFLKRMLVNRFFTLNHQRLKNWIFSYFRKNFQIAKSEGSCSRLFLLCQNRKVQESNT